MKERIDVVVTDAILSLNDKKKERMEATHRLKPTDRAPVFPDFQTWSLLAGRGSTYSEFVSSPREHLRGTLLNWKWRWENVPDDLPIETECLTIEPQYGALRGTEFPIEIEWMGDDPPKSIHLITEPEVLDTLSVPPPDGGLNAVRISWYRAMSEMVEDFDLRVNGQPVQIKIDLTHPGGPIPSAFALCGSNLFLWMKLYPDRVHRLMDIVTESHLQVIDYFAELTGREKGHSVWAGGDIAEMMSPSMFREFVVPYYLRIWEKQAAYPHTLHMCGKIDHIIDVISNEWDVTFFDRFGFPTDRNLFAKAFAGKAVMRGGPHPVLIFKGPVDRIVDECMDYIRTVGRHGGYILSDGVGIMPHTPMSHISAMVVASKRVAMDG